MDRRKFISGALAAGGAGILPGLTWAQVPSADRKSADRKITRAPWQKGFAGVTEAFPVTRLKIEGKWPKDLLGNFYRNGPARVQRAGIHLQHWFDGDGMVQRFSINNKGIFHQGQFVGTEKYLREEAAGKFLYNTTATEIAGATAPRNNDSVNVANTALMPWRGELLALWEAGSAYSLDPQTLKTNGSKTWSGDLANMPFSAHPLREKDGSLWNFGYIPYGEQARLAIYHINNEDKVIGLGVIPLIQNGYFHAFAQTEEYLIFYISACIFTSGATFIDSFSWQPKLGSKILVVNKNTLNVPRWFEAPPGFVFHFGNAWQDGKMARWQAD